MLGVYQHLRHWAGLAKRRVLNPGPWSSRVPTPRADEPSPIVVISSCESVANTGDATYNGGVKLYNLWVKLLRQHGYESYVVTYDGRYQPWLIEHQPHVSLQQVKEWKQQGRPLRFMTGWILARAFIELADSLYFFDAEMKYTCGAHLPSMKALMRTKIRSLATHSRTQQAWYMATFGTSVHYIPEWSDEEYWFCKPEACEPGLVGYMNEGEHTEKDLQAIADWCREAGIEVRFIPISGDEAVVLETMRRCDVYLGMNAGKHPLWGEGCPRAQQEAMHAGCVVIAYDVSGNREYLIDGYSGLLASKGRAGALAGHLIRIMRDPEYKARLRQNSSALASQVFTSATRWPAVRDFLELPELYSAGDNETRSGIVTRTPGVYVPSRTQLEGALGAAAYIHPTEIPLLCAYAAQSCGTIVEIGAAFGASATLLLANAPALIKVHSVDSFVPDSMSHGLHSTEAICRANVKRALQAVGREQALTRWCLHAVTSHGAAASWHEPIQMLYLDGDHHYESVRSDLETWLPFVELGGYVLIHDSRRVSDAPGDRFARGWYGPTRLAKELTLRQDLQLVDEAFSLTVWRKREAIVK